MVMKRWAAITAYGSATLQTSAPAWPLWSQERSVVVCSTRNERLLGDWGKTNPACWKENTCLHFNTFTPGCDLRWQSWTESLSCPSMVLATEVLFLNTRKLTLWLGGRHSLFRLPNSDICSQSQRIHCPKSQVINLGSFIARECRDQEQLHI